MATYTIKGVGTVQSGTGTGALTVPMPSGGGAPASGNLILIFAATRTASGSYSADPTASGYTLLKQATSFASGNACWGKLAAGGEGSVTVTPTVNGCISFAVVLSVSGGTWPAMGSIVVDSPASAATNLTNNQTIRMQAITPSTTGLVTVRLSSRLVQTSNTVTAITASSNFSNSDGTNPTWGYKNNSPNSHLVAAEFRLDGSNAANAQNDATITTISDSNTDSHYQMAFTLQSTSSTVFGDRSAFRGIGRGMQRGH